VELVDVRAGLAAAAAAVPGLNTSPHAPDAVHVPHFYPGESEINYDQTFGAGVDEAIITCYVLTAAGDDKDGQALLDQLLGRGPMSIKKALEADRTLGGKCMDLRVRRIQAYRRYGTGTDTFFGAQIVVYVIGQAEEE
jgi:hypothetical protein